MGRPKPRDFPDVARASVSPIRASAPFAAPHFPVEPGSPSAELQAMIDGLAELVAIVSCDGTILMINQHWQRVMDEQGGPFLVGRSYQGALCDLIEAGDARVKPILE